MQSVQPRKPSKLGFGIKIDGEPVTGLNKPVNNVLFWIGIGDTIPAIIEGLTTEQLAREFPEVVLQRPISTEQFLIHLYGHLNWHIGQVDIIRRIQTGQGAI